MPGPDPPPIILRCPACGRTTPFTRVDEMLVLLRGWPTCCGQGMIREVPESDAEE